jgi:hypothetical protein
MVAAGHSTEHRAGVDQPRDVRLRHAVLVAGDEVPDEEVTVLVVLHVDEDAAVAAVEGARAEAADEVRGEGCRGGGARNWGGAPCKTWSLWRRPSRGGVRWKAW